ncbi:hypothetical protein AZC_2951 [Azorhizobium caulinodans ORS 571]|uniref:DUF2569 domain-containing protein n=1 Tax=Azorhizobium caulinodans (strain ATCC 43989 / DSM 5975 / JCM 20966 / LMG 6465 / NBRC 14845 / NCIMB 13405 / ORS 571) TaxID=438753 RepID=A8IDJ6_AZOC5|nr:hypothetical protein [Azorhizobium caulinodans]BAF88949.1 hypothetical protein AZC_2951 [Azorhizobium caulinodans ORS 571]
MSALPPIPKPRRRSAQPGALGGLLAIIFWCACGITAVPLAGLFTLISAMGPQGAFSAIADSFSGSSASAQMLRLGLVPQFVLYVWAVTTVALTILRSRHALTLVPLALAVWVAVTAFCQFSIRSMITPGDVTFMDLAALLPGLLVQAAGVAALYGYFREGQRPAAFYTR